MKAYKGFKKDMTCRGFKFKEGKEYEEERAKLCKIGFHACEAPVDCFNYYAPGESVYHEVDLDDVTDERESDSKRVGKKIKIGARLSIADIINAQFEYVKNHCTNTENGGYISAVQGGDRSAVQGGDSSAVRGGYSSAVQGGDWSAVQGGDSSAVQGGDWSVLRGGVHSKFCGGMWAVFACEVRDEKCEVVKMAVAVVDGEKIKPNVWYRVENGEFVEVEA